MIDDVREVMPHCIIKDVRDQWQILLMYLIMAIVVPRFCNIHADLFRVLKETLQLALLVKNSSLSPSFTGKKHNKR